MEQMKKKKVFLTGMFLLLLSLFFSVLLPYYIPYNYPNYIPLTSESREKIMQRTDSKEWFQRHEESLQIPENLIKGQSTRALAISILNSPQIGFLTNQGTNFKAGYRIFSSNCNGVEELEHRKDIIPVIFQLYQEYPIQKVDELTQKEKNRISYFEMIIAQDEYVGQMNEEELKRFSEIAAEKYYEKLEKGWNIFMCKHFYIVLNLGSYADKIIPPDFSDLPK